VLAKKAGSMERARTHTRIAIFGRLLNHAVLLLLFLLILLALLLLFVLVLLYISLRACTFRMMVIFCRDEKRTGEESAKQLLCDHDNGIGLDF
jgi:hypothetical protein